MSTRRGLPNKFQPRHDKHYVDSLGEPEPETIGQLLPIEKITADSNQPRDSVGDLSGLKESIREKGIIEPLVVRKEGDSYKIISGERRYQAAKELGETKLPCIIRESDDQDTLEVALIENMQRLDLSPFEEADGLRQLSTRFQLPHEEIARKIGKSRSSVTESMSLSIIPEEIRTLCNNHGIKTKSTLLQIARQETAAEMLALTQDIISRGMTRDDARKARKENKESPDRPKPMTFKHKSKSRGFTLTLKFKKSEVEKTEMIEALKTVLAELERE